MLQNNGRRSHGKATVSFFFLEFFQNLSFYTFLAKDLTPPPPPFSNSLSSYTTVLFLSSHILTGSILFSVIILRTHQTISIYLLVIYLLIYFLLSFFYKLFFHFNLLFIFLSLHLSRYFYSFIDSSNFSLSITQPLSTICYTLSFTSSPLTHTHLLLSFMALCVLFDAEYFLF